MEFANRSRWLEVIRDESGQDMMEYAVVAALIALGAVVAMSSTATAIAGAFTSIGTRLASYTT